MIAIETPTQDAAACFLRTLAEMAHENGDGDAVLHHGVAAMLVGVQLGVGMPEVAWQFSRDLEHLYVDLLPHMGTLVELDTAVQTAAAEILEIAHGLR